MSGFVALRRETFERATGLNPIGYKIGLELICRCRCEHVVELPILFENRKLGQSKLNIEQQIRYLTHLSLLTLADLRDCCPERVTLFGIIPECYDTSAELSATLRARLPVMAELLVAELAGMGVTAEVR
jgi:hypothetical protein